MIEIKEIFDFLGKPIKEGYQVILGTPYKGRTLFKTTVKKIKWHGGSIVIITERNDRVRPSEVVVLNEEQ